MIERKVTGSQSIFNLTFIASKVSDKEFSEIKMKVSKDATMVKDYENTISDSDCGDWRLIFL